MVQCKPIIIPKKKLLLLPNEEQIIFASHVVACNALMKILVKHYILL